MKTKKVWKPERVHTRSIDRCVAKHNLEKKNALHRAIKSGHFANNWRVYAEH